MTAITKHEVEELRAELAEIRALREECAALGEKLVELPDQEDDDEERR